MIARLVVAVILNILLMCKEKMKTEYEKIESFVTKDGSLIRELMHPAAHANVNQSLAEAIVPVGIKTVLHCHHNSEELYHVIAGLGRMTLGDNMFEVRSGDTVCISPGVSHCIENIGEDMLKILCCCAPAYAHEDTELLE